MKNKKINWKLVGRVALAMAIAGVSAYISARKQLKNEERNKETK